MLLSEFLDKFSKSPLNIEIKDSFKLNLGPNGGINGNIQELIRVLNAGRKNRDIVIASAYHSLIKKFRDQTHGTYITNLSWWEQILLQFSNPDLHNRVLETVYDESVSSKKLIERVRRLGGSTYVFLTKFGPYSAIDSPPDEPQIKRILDRGVDGIMTDSPASIRPILDEWKQKMCPK
jgi:glycerophosphoryl diester phosphodiesterase